MSEYRHPMRNAVFHAYVRQDGKKAIARAEPYGLCPMIFIEDTAEEALRKAEKFRAETVEQNEANYAARMEAMAKAREARKAKEAADE